MRRSVHPAVTAALAVALELCAVAAHAQPPAPRPGPPRAAAKRDSTFAGVLLRHAWLEGGYGWLAAPSRLAERFESGQGYAVGLEARTPGRGIVRLGLEFQMLVARVVANYEAAPGIQPDLVDTTRFELDSRGWTGGLRAEAGIEGPLGIRLLAGVGRDYFDAGEPSSLGFVSEDALLRVREVAPDGWGWSYAFGVARSLQPLLPWPMGLDVHWRSLRVAGDDRRVVAIRLTSLRR